MRPTRQVSHPLTLVCKPHRGDARTHATRRTVSVRYGAEPFRFGLLARFSSLRDVPAGPHNVWLQGRIDCACHLIQPASPPAAEGNMGAHSLAHRGRNARSSVDCGLWQRERTGEPPKLESFYLAWCFHSDAMASVQFAIFHASSRSPIKARPFFALSSAL